MKKLLIGFFVLSLVLVSFVSCNSNAITEQDALGQVSFTGMQSAALKSLNAAVTHLGKADLYWRYTAVKTDNGGTYGKTADSSPAPITSSLPVVGTDSSWGKGLSQTHTFSVGTWEFTLYAFKANTIDNTSTKEPTAQDYYSYNDNYIYTGTVTATVVASTTTKVTVGVSATTTTGLNGTLDFSSATKPKDAGYKDAAILAYKYSDGTTSAQWSTTQSYSVTPGSYTAYVGVFNSSADFSAGKDPLVTSSINVTVYRGLTTKVGGSVDDQTGGVDFDVSMPVTAIAEKQQAATTASKLPAVTVIPQTSPDKIITKTETENTTVSIPEVTAPSDVTVNVGDNVATAVEVTAYSVKAAPKQFTVAQVGENNTAVAGIDCSYTVKVGNQEETTIKDFGQGNYATVTTYIEKGLSKVTVKYVGGEFTDRDPIAGYGSGGSTATNVADIYANDSALDASTHKIGYSQYSGKLVFKTDHFSTFCVATDAKVKIVETGYAYDSLEKAISAVETGQTVQLLQNVTVKSQVNIAGITLDGNSKSITADNSSWSGDNDKKMLLRVGSNTTVKNITLDSNNQACGVQAYAATNVVFENITANKANKGASVLVNASQAIFKGSFSASGNTWDNNSTNYVNLGWGSNVIGAPDKCTANVKECSDITFWTDASDISQSGGTYAAKFGITYDSTSVAKITNSSAAGELFTVASTLANAFSAVQAGGTITLQADCETGSSYTETNTLKLTKSGVTLDLNGNTVTTTKNFSFAITAENVIVKDGTIKSGQKRNASNQDDVNGAYYRGYPLVVGHVTENNVISGVQVNNVTIYGGISAGGSMDNTDSDIHGGAVVTLNNCTIQEGAAYALCSQLGSTLNVVSGNYSKGGTTASALAWAETGTASTISITGGTFNADPSPYVNPAYEAKANTPEAGKWKVVKRTAEGSVAKVGNDDYYATLADAFAGVKSGETITLCADCETGSSYTENNPLALATANVTLNLNGYTITETNNFSFVIAGNNDVVKNGKIDSGSNSAKACGYHSYALVVANLEQGKTTTGVVIDNVTFKGGVSVGGSLSGNETQIRGSSVVTLRDCSVTSGDWYAICTQIASTANIESGTYNVNTIDVPSGKTTYRAVFDNSSGCTISITGGTFGADPSCYVANGYTANALGTNPETWEVVAISYWIDYANTSWYDDHTGDTSYTLTSAEQFAGLAKLVNAGNTFTGKTISLGANISLADRYWTPIGTSDHPFSGVFDGNSNTISNLLVVASGEDGSGLFGYIQGTKNGELGKTKLFTNGTFNSDLIKETDYDCEIKNLTISKATISLGSGSIKNVAPCVGIAEKAYIKKVNISGNTTVNIYKYGAGIVGFTKTAVVDGCSVASTVALQGADTTTKTDGGGHIGGIVAYDNAEPVAIINCTNNAAISGKYGYIGGILAYAGGNANGNASVYNCINNGNITCSGTASYVAGIVGNGQGAPYILWCTNNGSVSGTASDSISGISSYFCGKIYSCVNNGNISGSSNYIGGLVGKSYQASVDIENSSNTGTVTNSKSGGVASDYVASAGWGTTISGQTYANVTALHDVISGISGTLILKNLTVTDKTGTLELPSTINNLISDAGYFAGLNISNCTADYVTVTIPDFVYTLHGDSSAKTLGLSGANNTTTFASDCKLNWLRNYGSNGKYHKESGCVVTTIHGATEIKN